MKKLCCILLFVYICVNFAGCAEQETRTYPTEDYILELPYTEDFRILHLPDIHMGNKDNRKLQYEYLDVTISESNADLIVLNGDLFTYADKITAKELFAFIDGYGIPWTVSLGNHDEQCYFSVDWLTGYLNDFGSNCVFKDIQDDDVFGYSNFAINLMQDGRVFEQIIIMDSNRYYCGNYWGYDYIKEDQIDWYERIVTDTKKFNGGETVDSLLFFHIPLPEFGDAWHAAQNGSPDAMLEYGELNEEPSCPEYNSGLFDKIVELGSGKAIIVGHDHINNYRILYDGIYLNYGITATDRIYYKEGMVGGQIITVHGDHSLSFDAMYHDYSEVCHE